MIKMKALQVACVAAALTLVGCGSMQKNGGESELSQFDYKIPLVEDGYAVEVGGVDANNNGVRDDVEKYIFSEFKESPQYIPELMAFSKTVRDNLIADQDFSTVGPQYVMDVVKHMACLDVIDKELGNKNGSVAYMEDLLERHADTELRRARVQEAVAGAKRSEVKGILNMVIFKPSELIKDCRPF